MSEDTVAEVDAALASTAVWEARVGSWLDGEFLGDIPVSGGSLTWSTGRDVLGTLTIDVPEQDSDGFLWNPGANPTHPLARYGQELTVDVTVRDPASSAEQTWRVGRYLIAGWEVADGVVSVEANSMMQRVSEDRFITPEATRTNSTITSEAQRLVPKSLACEIDSALTDRPVPSMSWDESRIDSLKEIASAWPARLREARDGTIQFLSTLPDVPTPELSLTDGEGGTVVSAPQSDSRDGVFNIVVARGQDSDGSGKPSFQGVAQQEVGPLRVGGPYGSVPRFFSSPLITNNTMAQRTASTMLADAIKSSTVRKITCAPDPRIWLDTALEVVWEESREWGFVSGFTLPLLGDSAMSIELEVTQ